MTPYRERIQDLLIEYAWRLDNDKLEEWTELFTEDARYEILPRDNFDRGYPLALLCCRNQAMLRDRILALRVANEYNIHYDRHMINAPKIMDVQGDEICIEANYLVVQTSQDGVTKVFSAGLYKDRIKVVDGQLRFKEKLVIADTFCVPTLIATPI
ncbi:anthranilate 1,2-dioxygenase [Pusillimonas sp. T2]|uniref:aromatic-ring-hydroxylating dioxygenase subunit beta n=1 Tax=Pusillimonas sp. T2 TaxID=1548123 RepID=UPI000B8B5FFB|nr:nuclear transport factor 2 family protein [Pusillimonas sp. T2]OXR48074.1 anthranilate 1,2-dioxygenase [Pusillimonas sp. T2]